jgi:hypothetical protein
MDLYHLFIQVVIVLVYSTLWQSNSHKEVNLGYVLISSCHLYANIGLPSDEKIKKTKNSMAVVSKRTIPTERPPLVGEVSANLCG